MAEDSKSPMRRSSVPQEELSLKRKRILQFLGPIDQTKYQETKFKLRRPGTGLWFTQGAEFKHWYSTKNAKLWLRGNPGVGKTVLTSVIIEETQSLIDQNNGIDGLAYFYCVYNDPLTHGPINIVGSLIKQFALQNEQAFEELEAFYNKHNLVEKPATLPTAQELYTLLQRVTGCFENAFIIVDALDESGEDRSLILELFQSLDTVANSSIKTLFSSRRESDIELYLSKYTQVSVSDNSGDLRDHIASEIERRSVNGSLQIRDSELKEDIIGCLNDKAHGMVWWVTCRLDYLCELATDRDRRKALAELPPTLFATYERILDRVNASTEQNKVLVERVLRWIICAETPLSTEALLEVISVNEGDRCLDRDSILQEDDILRWCSSLVRRRSDSTGFELSHFSVKEFLFAIDPADDRFSRYRIEKGADDLELGKICLTYLCLDDFAYEDENDHVDCPRDTEFPFWSYAARHWDDHASHHFGVEALGKLAQKLFAPSKTHQFLSWSKKASRDLDSDSEIALTDVTPLHWASALALPDLCKWLIEQGCDVNKSSSLGTPLQCALLGKPHFYVDEKLDVKEVRSAVKWREGARSRTIDLLLPAGASFEFRLLPRYQRGHGVITDRDRLQTMKGSDGLMMISNMATLLEVMSKHDKAEEMLRRALQGRENYLDLEDPYTLIVMDKLANILWMQHKYDEVEIMSRETLQLRKQILGSKHPDTLMNMQRLANILGRQQKYDEAEIMYRETLQLSTQVLGREHPDTILSIKNLVLMLKDQGKYDEAKDFQGAIDAIKQAESADTESDLDSIVSVESQGTTLLGSSVTSGTTLFEQTALDQIFLIFAEDDVLRFLYAEALQKRKLESKRFEDNLQRLIRQYCVELYPKAHDVLNGKALQLLKSQRKWISRRIREQFCPTESQRIRDMDRLREQVANKIPIMERYLATTRGISNDENINNMRNHDSSDSDGSDSDENMPKHDDTESSKFPHFEEVKAFLVNSQPFENLRVNLRRFIYPKLSKDSGTEEKSDSNTTEQDLYLPIVQKFQHSIAISVLGILWVVPLCHAALILLQITAKTANSYLLFQCRKLLDAVFEGSPLPSDTVRLEWTCKCGYQSYDDMIERQPGSVEALARELQDAGVVKRANTTSRAKGYLTMAKQSCGNFWIDTKSLMKRSWSPKRASVLPDTEVRTKMGPLPPIDPL